MVQSDHRNDSLIHSHIAVLQFVFFSLAHRNVFSIHSRMASEADLLKLNIVRFVLMRLLCFIDAGKIIIYSTLLEFISVCYVLVSYDYDAFFFNIVDVFVVCKTIRTFE